MFDNKKFYLLLAGYFILLLIPAYWLPLFETTDARYAEIAREMLASHNFMEPFYNGIKHFHKPPFTYWINALGLYIFGINGFGARFFGALASVIILIYTRKTAYVLTDDRKIADKSVLILASSFLFLIVSRVVSTDIYLVMFTIMTLYHLFSQIYVRKSMSNAILIGLYAGLGFLTKGPVVFLFTLLPFVVAKIFEKKHRHVFTLSQGLAVLVVFAAVALPWYAYVVSVNHGLLEYFLYDQTVERVATDKFERSKPFYFFFVVFFGTFIPWIFFMFKNYSITNKLKTGWVSYLYIIMPFIVFQISTSKLGTYILPFYPVAAIIAALNTDSKLIRKLSFALLIIAGFVPIAAPLILDYTKPHMVAFISTGVFLVLFTVIVSVRYSAKNYVMSFTVVATVMTLAVYCLIPLVGPYVKGYRLVAEDIKSFDPAGKYNIMVYSTFVPVLSFYMGKVVPIAYSKERETQFQEPSTYEDALIRDEVEMKRYLSNNKELIILFRKQKGLDAFVSETGYTCDRISIRGGKKIIALCKSPDSSN